MPYTHQLNMFKRTKFKKTEKQTRKTGTQVFSPDSNEIQLVL